MRIAISCRENKSVADTNNLQDCAVNNSQALQLLSLVWWIKVANSDLACAAFNCTSALCNSSFAFRLRQYFVPTLSSKATSAKQD